MMTWTSKRHDAATVDKQAILSEFLLAVIHRLGQPIAHRHQDQSHGVHTGRPNLAGLPPVVQHSPQNQPDDRRECRASRD